VVPLKDPTRSFLSRATEPQILFPLIAVFLLTIIWVSTFGILRVKRGDAEHVAAVSTRDLLDTYEAQVGRALHEIDKTLSLVQFLHERGGATRLVELRDNDLLPPDLLFVVRTADRSGAVVDSTRPAVGQNVASQDNYRAQHDKDNFYIGQLARGSTESAQLHFSRRLSTSDGTFDGAVIIAVDADYFVSAYDVAQFGQQGVLGLLGADGIFRVRRTGDTVFSGDRIDYANVVPGPDAIETEATVSTSSWDVLRQSLSQGGVICYFLRRLPAAGENDPRPVRLHLCRRLAGDPCVKFFACRRSFSLV
jgi:hypothetical protein